MRKRPTLRNQEDGSIPLDRPSAGRILEGFFSEISENDPEWVKTVMLKLLVALAGTRVQGSGIDAMREAYKKTIPKSHLAYVLGATATPLGFDETIQQYLVSACKQLPVDQAKEFFIQFARGLQPRPMDIIPATVYATLLIEKEKVKKIHRFPELYTFLEKRLPPQWSGNEGFRDRIRKICDRAGLKFPKQKS